MARDYGRKTSNQRKSAGSKHLLAIVCSFLIGYLTASVFDVNALSQWLNKQVSASKKQAKAEPVPAKPKAQAQLPRPKFEFYTLLTKDQQVAAKNAKETPGNRDATTQVASQAAATVARNAKPVERGATKEVVKVAEGKPLKPTTADKNRYLIQVASFRAKQDAERVKAALILKGYEVNIAALNQTQGSWFRVILGPYAGKTTAQKALSDLAKNEHIKGMIRKQA